MPAQLGNIISKAEYNAIQSKIADILGPGDGGETGYGRSLQSSQITTSKVIESEDMLALYNDLVKARTHQKGASLSWTNTDGLASPSDDELIGVFAADIGTNPNDPTDISSAFALSDTSEGFADFESAATDIVSGHDLQGSGQMTISQTSSSTRDTQWGGGDISAPGSFINHTVTITWQNADERRYFFNSGGEIHFSAVNVDGLGFGGSAGAKTLNWRSMLSTQGTIIFGKNSTAATGTNPGTGSNIGNYYTNWNLTNSSNPAIIYQKLGTSTYSDNSYTIQAWETASNSIRFNIVFQDGDLGTGSPGVAGDTPIDEYVEGETTSTVNLKTATGALSIPIPSSSTTSTLAGGVGGSVTINLSANQTEINEGESVVFSLTTTNVAAGTLIPYAITGVSTTDITGSLTGTFEVGTTDTITVTTVEDEITDGDKTMVMTLPSNGNVSRSCIVKDTSKGIGYTLSGPSSMLEGQSAQYDFEAGNLLANETFWWQIDATNTAAFGQSANGLFVYDITATGAQGPLLTLGTNTTFNDSFPYTLTIYRYGPPGDPNAVGVISLTNLTAVDATEDVFTVLFDSTVLGSADPASGVDTGNSGDDFSKIVFRMWQRSSPGTGDLNGDIQFRIRPTTAVTTASTNTWLYSTSTTDDILMQIDLTTPGQFFVDFKGTGALQFGDRYPGTLNTNGSIMIDLWGSGGKVIDVTNWGTQFNPTTFTQMFRNCSSLTGFSAFGHPRLMGSPGDMTRMFENCISLTGDSTNGKKTFSTWDMSGAVLLDHMFLDCYDFVGEVGTWNVSNVTRMESMFQFCHKFNTDISGWDVSNVTNMAFMFGMYNNNLLVPPANQGLFNQDIGNWDVANVVQMDGMFFSHVTFNQDLSNWCVTNITSEPQSWNSNGVLAQANYPVWGTCPPLDPVAPPQTGFPSGTYVLEAGLGNGTASPSAAAVDSFASELVTASQSVEAEAEMWIDYAVGRAEGIPATDYDPIVRIKRINGGVGQAGNSRLYPVGTFPNNGGPWSSTDWVDAATYSILAGAYPPAEVKVNITQISNIGFGVVNNGTLQRQRHGTGDPDLTAANTTNITPGTWVSVLPGDSIRLIGPTAFSGAYSNQESEYAGIAIEVEIWVRGLAQAPVTSSPPTYNETLIYRANFQASAFASRDVV